MQLVLCKSCGLQRKYAGKDICNGCLYKKRISTPEKKKALTEKKRLEYLKRKGLCLNHVFVSKQENCKICLNQIKEEKRISKTLCHLCYKKEYYKKNPEKKEKERLRQYQKTRIKNGLPLDHPPLIARPGQGSMSKQGYKDIWKPGHPNCKNKLGRIYEHVWVMSEYLGRPLIKGETVHHMNGVRDDNRIENLELWNRGQPSGQRVEDRIKFYKEFLEQYGYEITKR